MTKLLRFTTTLMLVLAVSISASAQEKKKDGKGRKRGAATIPVPKGIELDDAQMEKFAELQKEFGPKLAELGKKTRDLIGPDQVKARQAALKAAREAGKKGAELRKAADEALALTDEQKSGMAALQKERRELQSAMRGALMKILTDEQKTKVRAGNKGKGNRKKPNAA